MRARQLLIPLALAAISLPSLSFAQVVVGVSITVAPPVLPVYVQPPIPAPGYIWTPGYWAYGGDGYYWVPGTWVLPPAVGLLWTPGYWGWREGVYVWNAGYWGPHIGYYGGINYGFGYVGVGYDGGHWDRGVFAYNRTVNNFGSVNIVNTYSKTIINNTTVNQVSFNGPSGATAHPTAQELSAGREQHTPPTGLQTQHALSASTNRSLLASVNHGNPGIAATSKPGAFSGPGVVGSKGTAGASNNPVATGATKQVTNGPGAVGSKGTPAAPNNPVPTGVTKQVTNGPGNSGTISGSAPKLPPSNASGPNPPPSARVGANIAGPPHPGPGPRKPPPPKKPERP